jgi:hypothetical protein
MKRYLCWFALVLVIAAPAAAAACWPMWGRPGYAPRAYSPPMYAMPVYVNPPLCQPPAHGYVLPPPRIEWVPRPAVPTPAPAPGMGTAIPDPMPPRATPTRAPAIETIRPAGASDAPPKKTDPPAVAPKPATPSGPPQDPDLTFPKVEIPKDLRPQGKLPPLELPKEPDMRAVPKVPAVGASKDPLIPAIPSAAPAPESLIPPPSVPLVPDPNKRDPLPSLTLPPDIPVAPEKKSDSTSRSSPLTGGASSGFTVSVFPAKGAEAPPAGYRTVGFYNHTTRDLALTIEGHDVKLPAKTYLYAQLAATFTWSHGGRSAARETVPEGAGGVEVVFRD